MRREHVGLWAALTLAAHHGAAQELRLTGPLEGAAPASKGYSSKGVDRIVMPTGHLEVGAETALVTSRPRLTEEPLRFTDLVLFRSHVRRSFADWLDVGAGVSLLPKQPSAADESAWQGAGLGAQAEFAPGFAASLDASMGPLLDGAGLYYQGGPSLLWKPRASQHLHFGLSLGNAWTVLDFDGSGRAFWLGEVASEAEVQIGDDDAAMWVTLDYDVPFASSPDAESPDPERGYLDPQVRFNVEVGGALNLGSKGWTVFAAYRFVDRGELERPETTLPILDGGFDQQQTLLGVEYRFMPEEKDVEDDAWQQY